MADGELAMMPIEHLQRFGLFTRERIHLREVALDFFPLNEDRLTIDSADTNLGLEDPHFVLGLVSAVRSNWLLTRNTVTTQPSLVRRMRPCSTTRRLTEIWHKRLYWTVLELRASGLPIMCSRFQTGAGFPSVFTWVSLLMRR